MVVVASAINPLYIVFVLPLLLDDEEEDEEEEDENDDVGVIMSVPSHDVKLKVVVVGVDLIPLTT